MSAPHLTEEEIQQYAIEPLHGPEMDQHIHTCEQCKEKIEAYQSLFAALQQQPRASFDFNLAGLVMEQLPGQAPKTTRESSSIYFFVTAAIAITIFVLYNFRDYPALLFASIAPVFIYLVLTASITLSMFLIADMYKKYKKKIHTLELYNG